MVSIPEVQTHTDLDNDLAVLVAQRDAWARRPVAQKIDLLAQLIHRTQAAAERWVAAAVKAKGLAGTPLEGEEWISGPWAVLRNMQSLLTTLRAIQAGTLRSRVQTHTRANGQLVVDVFPNRAVDHLLFSGYRAEVWMQPGVNADNLDAHMASFYRQSAPAGKVALVLAAGNLTSIAPLDMLHKLFIEGQAIIVKMNPVNDYIGPILEEVFAPLVQAGVVRFAYGGPEVGEYLVAHPHVDEIHITGSARTHDLIVYGKGPEGEARKARREPLLQKRITSELGAVCPVIVVPGPWNNADIAYHAASIATMKMHNGGFNCVAAQVVILPENWPQGDALLAAVSRIMQQAYPRPAYYPGAAQRQQAAVHAHPQARLLDQRDVPTTLIPDLDPNAAEDVCFRDEAFGGVLSFTCVPGDTPAAFLANAVRFANERLLGTLGANVLVHPQTQAALGDAFDQAIADLRYGAVAINCWTGVNYFVAECTWGAYPGHTYEDIQSGIGVVHNTLMLENAEKSVSYAPFTPYPRTLLTGHFHLSPKPSWFITNRMAHIIGQRVTYFEADPSVWRLPSIVLAALLG